MTGKQERLHPIECLGAAPGAGAPVRCAAGPGNRGRCRAARREVSSFLSRLAAIVPADVPSIKSRGSCGLPNAPSPPINHCDSEPSESTVLVAPDHPIWPRSALSQSTNVAYDNHRLRPEEVGWRRTLPSIDRLRAPSEAELGLQALSGRQGPKSP